jgi:putative ABC transport system ATP-binding protein
MGPSGSGKSTLMNMVGALDTPTNGKVDFGEQDISQLSENQLAQLRGEKVGFIFQEFNLIPTMTAEENVQLPMLFKNKPKKQSQDRSSELLEEVGLGDRKKHFPNELSGGQRQRVSIARALANDPAVVLADEPTGNLDSKTGEKVLELLQRLNQDEGKTIIMVTHDKNDAEYADYIINIKDGEIQKQNNSQQK